MTFRRILESTGIKGRAQGKSHRANAELHRKGSDRAKLIEDSLGFLAGAVLLEDIELTTTPQNFNHQLKLSMSEWRERRGIPPESRVGLVGEPPPRAFKGAFIVKRANAGFYLIAAEPAGPPATLAIALSVSAGTETVSVAVF